MVLGDICDEVENGTSILIDYSKGNITVKNSNGSEPEVYIFEIRDFVEIKTIGPKQVSIKSNKGSNGDSGNGSGETEPEAVSGNVQSELGLEVSLGNDLNDIQETGVSAEIKPGIVQAAPSFREVTAKEIAGEIQNAVDLSKGEAKILAALISRSRGATKGEIHKITGIPYSDILAYLTRLIEELHLVYYGDKKIIKPNYEKIKSLFPWIFIVEIQKAISELSSKNVNEPKLVFGKATPKIIHLLYKYPNGLTKKAIIDGTGLSFPSVSKAIESMVRKDLIKIEKKEIQIVIFPNFSIDQIEENLIMSEESVAIETNPVQETAEAEEQIADFNTDEEDSTISEEPAVVETAPAKETKQSDCEDTVRSNNNPRTESGFVLSEIENISRRIKSHPEGSKGFPLSNISSQFKAGIGKGLTELLDEINEITPIEIFDDSSNETIRSWEPENFQNIKFEKLYIRKFSGEQAKNKREPEEDKERSKQKATTETIKPDELPTSKTIIMEVKKEIKPEDIINRIGGMIATPNLGDAHKTVMSILRDNYSKNSSLEMEVSDLMKIAQEKKLGNEQVRACYPALQVLGFIKKPDKTIKLNINT